VRFKRIFPVHEIASSSRVLGTPRNDKGMDLLKTTKQLCKLYDIKPARSRGQNFLIKKEIYDEIIRAANLKKTDIVLEVGPGLGFLTTRLAKIAKKVVAVELDDKLAEVLRTSLISQGIYHVKSGDAGILPSAKLFDRVKNVEVVNDDILEFPISDFRFPIYKVVANLPYNITSIFLRKFLSAEKKPEMMVLMLQKEVAQRIIASPPKMSLLAVSVQFYAEVEIIEIAPATCFWPRPEVDSAIIKLKVNPMKSRQAGILPEAKLFHGVNEKEFFRMVKIGFSAKRKMLKNNLAAGYHMTSEEAEKRIKRAGFNPKIRAQELSVDNWIKLLTTSPIYGSVRGEKTKF